MNSSPPPSLRAYLLTRILLITGLFAVALTGTAELYLRGLFERQQTMNFKAALDSAAKAIRSDLEIGDLWSVRRNLMQVVDGGSIRAIELSNDSSGELILSVPDSYSPPPPNDPGRRAQEPGQYRVTWKSPQAGIAWTLMGLPGQRTASLAETRTRGAYFFAILVLVLSFAVATWFLANRLVSDIGTIDRALSQMAPDKVISESDPGLATLEARRAYSRIQETSRALVDAVERQKELAVQSAVGNAAQQVAHDIRSPLAALDSAMRDLTPLPEDTRTLLRSAVGRIRDIANDLIEKSRGSADGATANGPKSPVPSTDAAQPHLVSSIIESLVTEKRLQFRSHLRIEVEFQPTAASYGIFTLVPPSAFKRVLSNLINNAVEALPQKGHVTIRLAANGNDIEILVQDNGPGIPAAVLERLGRRGETHGKPGGTGLGLYHAKTNVEAWGGRFAIDSEVGRGTTVSIHLPRAEAPNWFVSSLQVGPKSTVVIIDDDNSIHQIWRRRFDSVGSESEAVRVLHFSTPEEFHSWFKSAGAESRTAIFLMDYEFAGRKANGLDLTEELAIGNRAILVTSRFEEGEILSAALRLGVRMIPKPLAGFVPISVISEPIARRTDAVLIDDDALTRLNWKIEAEKKRLSLASFGSIDEFLAGCDGLNRATPIYVDANLANGIDGASESTRLAEIGFSRIFLATGHDSARFSGLAHICGVIGKDPPWATEDA